MAAHSMEKKVSPDAPAPVSLLRCHCLSLGCQTVLSDHRVTPSMVHALKIHARGAWGEVGWYPRHKGKKKQGTSLQAAHPGDQSSG